MNKSLLNAVNLYFETNVINLSIGHDEPIRAFNKEEFDRAMHLIYTKCREEGIGAADTLINLVIGESESDLTTFIVDPYPRMVTWSDLTILSRLSSKQAKDVAQVINVIDYDNYDTVIGLIKILVNNT